MEVIQPCTEQTYLNQIRYQYTDPTCPWQHFKYFDLGSKSRDYTNKESYDFSVKLRSKSS